MREIESSFLLKLFIKILQKLNILHKKLRHLVQINFFINEKCFLARLLTRTRLRQTFSLSHVFVQNTVCLLLFCINILMRKDENDKTSAKRARYQNSNRKQKAFWDLSRVFLFILPKPI
jgi:hypothetical protein